MINLEHVSKKYARHLPYALDDVSLDVDPGEFLFLVGKSGAGKSTLIRMLIREDIPDDGRIVVGGIDYSDLRKRHIPHLRRRIGVVFQDFKLLPSRTVFENVAFALEIVGASGHEIRRTVPKVLDLVGLAHKAQDFPGQLSGGEIQRVAIARSVARQPKILIADEPTANLDTETTSEIIQLLLKINQMGTTTLIATHNESVVNRVSRRVITLRGGRLVGDQKDAGRYQITEAPEPRAVKQPGHTHAAVRPQSAPVMRQQPVAQPQPQVRPAAAQPTTPVRRTSKPVKTQRRV